MEEENLRLYIKPAHSGYLCLIQLECEYTGTTITNNKMKADISTNSLPSVAAYLFVMVQCLSDLLSKQEVVLCA